MVVSSTPSTPTTPRTSGIVDLRLAPPNEEGHVQFYADFEIVAPVDLDQAQPTVLYVVNNRGRRTWGSQPFFLSRGMSRSRAGGSQKFRSRPGSSVWRHRVANDKDGVNVVGTVRAELSTDESADRLPFSNQLSYEPLASRLAEATLTRRLREKDSPQEIPRDRWRIQITKGPREEGAVSSRRRWSSRRTSRVSSPA